MHNRITAVFLCLAVVLTLTACGKATVKKSFKTPDNLSVADSETVAENENYRLHWDADSTCVLLTDLADNVLWSTIPYEYLLAGESGSTINSPMIISYYNPENGSLETSKAYSECISEGNYSVEKIDNGIKMVFYFLDAEATVPLCFELRDNSVAISIPLKDIEESGTKMIIDISVLPYLCSCRNSNEHDCYVLFPSGSGALMYTEEEKTDNSRTFTADVYGVDYGRKLLDHSYDAETVRLPVFGVKDGEKALFSIIESGEGAAKITADVGNTRQGYSTVYPTFQLRSYDETETARNDYSDERIYAESFDRNLTYTIGYYPLFREDADYVGMANCYKKYLKLSDSEKSKQSAIHLNFIGGDCTKHFIMGVPYMAFTSATTFNDVAEILKDYSKIYDGDCTVTLQGFGSTGNTVGKVAGGYTFSTALGGMKGYRALKNYCAESNTRIFTMFDTARFAKSSAMGSTLLDVAKTASHQKSKIYPLTDNLRFENKDKKPFYLLKRDVLPKVFEQLLKFTEKEIEGIGLSDIGNFAYSDYSSDNYSSKGNLSQITELIEKLRKENHTVACVGGNAYAAVVSDVLTGVSLQNGGSPVFDEIIPFYQLVFSSKAMYSEPLNTVSDGHDLMLRAVEMGVSPTYSVCQKYDEGYTSVSGQTYYASVYQKIREQIADTSSQTSAFFSAISSAMLVSHEIMQSGVSVSEFSNGIRVYVNKTSADVTVDGITVQARSFRYFDAPEAVK